MILTELQLQDFRSFKVRRFDFSENSTLLVGGNGVGKTNALEAVALLSTGKSFRATREEQMIRGDEEMGRVRGVILDGRLVTTEDAEEQTENAEELEIVLTRGEIGGEPYFAKVSKGRRVQRKRYGVNGVAKRRMDFLGKLPMVLFRPEDLELVLGNPTRRRDYLDSVLEQVDRDYRRSLLSYKKGLRQRNKLLMQIQEGKAQRTALVFWDQLLIKNGDVVMQKRAAFFDFVNKAFARERISQVLAGLEVVYDRSVISEKRLEQYATEEVAAGATLVGPHRDDFLVQVERGRGTKKQKRDLAIYGSWGEPRKKKDLAIFGSRGEQRLAVLSLKLAELSFVTQVIGERPLLMLDDIFSELDHEHRADVLAVVRQQQTILTTTDLHLIDKKYLGKMKVIEL